MPALRLILRASPFLLGALAAALWLRRGQVARLQLEPPKAASAESPEAAAAERPKAASAEPPEPEAADLPEAESDARPPTGRFRREPIDIVTVVDDLLVPGGS